MLFVTTSYGVCKQSRYPRSLVQQLVGLLVRFVGNGVVVHAQFFCELASRSSSRSFCIHSDCWAMVLRNLSIS